jgi:hypothetical protein
MSAFDAFAQTSVTIYDLLLGWTLAGVLVSVCFLVGC